MSYLPLLRQFEIENPAPTYSEQEVLQLLSERIAWMLEHQTELLFSLLYRMDIEEKDMRIAMDPASALPAPQALATLIIERQRKRMQSKQDIRVEEIDPDLAW